jgi:hypothetical protein
MCAHVFVCSVHAFMYLYPCLCCVLRYLYKSTSSSIKSRLNEFETQEWLIHRHRAASCQSSISVGNANS